jgi:hypothetical protein
LNSMSYVRFHGSRRQSVLVRNTKTVELIGLAALQLFPALGCGQQTKSPATGSVTPSSASSATAPTTALTPALTPPVTSGSTIAQSPAAPPSASAASTSGPSPASEESTRRSGSAYFGCGAPIPTGRLWDETTADEVFSAISAAKACARSERRRVLLEFVAPWCADCREMAELESAQVVAQALSERFERVRINVGKWDRHEGLRESFGVKALATYIVLDPTTSKLLAKTTLEPVTRRGPKLTAEDWARWLRAH